MSEVSIKFLMPSKVAFIEKEGAVGEVGKALEQLSQFLKEKKVKITGAAMGLFQDDPKSFNPQKARYEVSLPISGKLKEEGGVKSKELEKGAFACLTHSGPIEKLPDTYQAILKWIEDNGYQSRGPFREVYHKGIGEAGVSPQECLIEIQFPVKK
ncbi:MAG: GyrI-like domain-containing protein [Deltaproteobacteria bacterium]|nr:GyrI-like domain-containing protein [Deltaproteobacteria bacterium]